MNPMLSKSQQQQDSPKGNRFPSDTQPVSTQAYRRHTNLPNYESIDDAINDASAKAFQQVPRKPSKKYGFHHKRISSVRKGDVGDSDGDTLAGQIYGSATSLPTGSSDAYSDTGYSPTQVDAKGSHTPSESSIRGAQTRKFQPQESVLSYCAMQDNAPTSGLNETQKTEGSPTVHLCARVERGLGNSDVIVNVDFVLSTTVSLSSGLREEMRRGTNDSLKAALRSEVLLKLQNVIADLNVDKAVGEGGEHWSGLEEF